jgi:hypothetical protein
MAEKPKSITFSGIEVTYAMASIATLIKNINDRRAKEGGTVVAVQLSRDRDILTNMLDKTRAAIGPVLSSDVDDHLDLVSGNKPADKEPKR